MASKRMFNMKIMDFDTFLDLPLSAQALYVHLNMRADDDGFIGNAKRITAYVGASRKDLELLVEKRFVLIVDDVYVIKHWKIHNTLFKDRYCPTQYQDELKKLYIKENKSYSEVKQNVNSFVNSDDNSVVTLDKDKDKDLDKDLDLEKDNNSCASDESRCSDFDETTLINMSNFEKIYAIYPLKKGKQDAFRHYKAWGNGTKKNDCGVKKLTNKQMFIAVYRYVEETKEAGKLDYLMHFSTFMNNGIIDYLEDENEVGEDE